MVAIWVMLVVFILMCGTEALHARRIDKMRHLAFGPTQQPHTWAQWSPLYRILAMTALSWGLVTLCLLEPKIHAGKELKPDEYQHLIVLLDVSPSMDLKDAGPTGTQTRKKRAKELLDSIFQRTMVQNFKISVFAVYTGAEPVVEETIDGEVVSNIMNDLPVYSVFTTGKTDLFKGLEKAAALAKPWNPRSTALILVSDGDTVPATGMPRMPPSVHQVLVLGVGDPLAGKFIDGHQSRQDTSTLRQIAIRLKGTYHNGNKEHVDTSLAQTLMAVPEPKLFERLTLREYALFACGIGALTLAFLPVLLQQYGKNWNPGVHRVNHSSQSFQSSVKKQELAVKV
jgi:Ca-activated chloride channel family protein